MFHGFPTETCDKTGSQAGETKRCKPAWRTLALDRNIGDFSGGRSALCAGACRALRRSGGKPVDRRGRKACRCAVDRRGSGASRHFQGCTARNPWQSAQAGPHGDAAPASARPHFRAAVLPDPRGGRAGTDGGTRPPDCRGGTRGAACHPGGSACRFDRAAGLPCDDQQEPNLNSRHVHAGVER